LVVRFAIALEARDPALSLARAYGLEAGQDLFGTWVVELRHGRIGHRGRTRLLAFDSEVAARAEIRRCLKRRATAPRRIGTGYQVVAMEGGAWLEEGANA
jgi:predicted DNA-binding WGR domain protein